MIELQETIWGLGLTQNVDAAASTLYLGYRHMEADITCRSTATNCGGAGSANGTVNKLADGRHPRDRWWCNRSLLNHPKIQDFANSCRKAALLLWPWHSNEV